VGFHSSNMSVNSTVPKIKRLCVCGGWVGTGWVDEKGVGQKVGRVRQRQGRERLGYTEFSEKIPCDLVGQCNVQRLCKISFFVRGPELDSTMLGWVKLHSSQSF